MTPQGMSNATLNFGLFFTTVLGFVQRYAPGLPQALGPTLSPTLSREGTNQRISNE